MSHQNHIKPISYLKSNAAKIVNELREEGSPYIITQNGEAAMVVQSVEEYERKENTIAMLQMIAIGEQEITSGEVEDAQQVFSDINDKLFGQE